MSTHYHAFISYNHADKRWAKWLQSSLERYRLPKQLASEKLKAEAGSNRLFPIFRDRDELASSADLSQSIRTALEQSAALIVICSPAAAQSKWVNEEIREFKRLGRAGKIFCLLVDGSTNRNAPDCAFPPALLTGANDEALPEPLAADISPAEDGKRGAMLKIAAGLLDVGVDALKQRDAQRQLRRRGMITAASVAISIVTLALAIVAQIAREEAEVRREQAEGLISFMLGDLRDRLEPLGRLNLLDSVGDEAMRYFAVLGERGTEQEVYARVMALRQIGEVRFRQGQYARAQESFVESRDLAEALHGAYAGNADYLFELGQAEFWVGYAALEQNNLEQTAASFEKYMQYSRQLLAADPENPDYQAELSYAYSNLGTVALQRLDAETALENFKLSVQLNYQSLTDNPDDVGLRLDLGNGYSWIGATQLELGNLDESREAYANAVEILTELDLQSDSPLYSENRAQNVYHLGDVMAQQGESEQAGEMFRLAGDLLEALVSHDPENAVWRVDRAINNYHQGELLRATGSADAAREMLGKAHQDFQLLLVTDPGNTRSIQNLALTERSLGQINRSPEMVSSAFARMASLIADAEMLQPRIAFIAALVGETHGRMLNESGQGASAAGAWNEALALLGQAGNPVLGNLALEYRILTNLGEAGRAAPLWQQLQDAGYRDPRFLEGKPSAE